MVRLTLSSTPEYRPKKDVEELDVTWLGGGDGRPVAEAFCPPNEVCEDDAADDVEAAASDGSRRGGARSWLSIEERDELATGWLRGGSAGGILGDDGLDGGGDIG